VYGNDVFAADDFNNAVAAYPAAHGGTIKPSQQISGSATGLNGPIAVVISSLSSQAAARPVTGVTHTPAHPTLPVSRTHSNKDTLQ